jgi:hypothetical protein
MTYPQPVADARLLLAHGLVIFDFDSKHRLSMVRNPVTGEDELCIMIPPASAREHPFQLGKNNSPKKDDGSGEIDGRICSMSVSINSVANIYLGDNPKNGGVSSE